MLHAVAALDITSVALLVSGNQERKSEESESRKASEHGDSTRER